MRPVLVDFDRGSAFALLRGEVRGRCGGSAAGGLFSRRGHAPDHLHVAPCFEVAREPPCALA
eukprot:8193822-Alexandrium_andersonii.AAC.1